MVVSIIEKKKETIKEAIFWKEELIFQSKTYTFYVILSILGGKGGQGGSRCNFQKCSIPCEMEQERRRRNEFPLK